jgi:hypothetical protein
LREVFGPTTSPCYNLSVAFSGAVAQLGARLDGIEEVAGSNPAGSTTWLHRYSAEIKPLADATCRHRPSTSDSSLRRNFVLRW